MKTARLPIDVEADHLGTIDLTEGELRDRFGEGATPAPTLFSYPGPVLLWPLELDDGQLVLLLRDLTGGFTFVMANPKDLDRAVNGLGIAPDRVTWRKPGLSS